jgi:hypothetical protein
MVNSQPFELLIFVVLFILMALCLVSTTIIHSPNPEAQPAAAPKMKTTLPISNSTHV